MRKLALLKRGRKTVIILLHQICGNSRKWNRAKPENN
jgi:hypothetical protein